MNNIIPIQNKNILRYTIKIVKYNNKNITRNIAICLTNTKTGKTTNALPITCITNVWIGKKLSTIKNNVGYFVRMLNYITFEQENTIDDFSNVTQDMILDYFKYLSKISSRNYILQSENAITKALYYLVERNALPNFSKNDFIITNKKNSYSITYYLKCIHNKYPFPACKQTKKVHNLDFDIVFKMIEISMEICPAISFALYCQTMGGMRASEVLSIEYTDISYNTNNTSFMVNLTNKDLRQDISYGFINQVKRPRKQMVFVIDGLFDKIYKLNKELTKDIKSNAICIDRNGNPMTYAAYYKNFNKVKNELLTRMEKSKDVDTKLYARYLATQDWSTHIFRGVYSNLIAEHSNNAMELAKMRGDNAVDSALPYIEHTEKLTQEINKTLEDLYGQHNN